MYELYKAEKDTCKPDSDECDMGNKLVQLLYDIIHLQSVLG